MAINAIFNKFCSKDSIIECLNYIQFSEQYYYDLIAAEKIQKVLICNSNVPFSFIKEVSRITNGNVTIIDNNVHRIRTYQNYTSHGNQRLAAGVYNEYISSLEMMWIYYCDDEIPDIIKYISNTIMNKEYKFLPKSYPRRQNF